MDIRCGASNNEFAGWGLVGFRDKSPYLEILHPGIFARVGRNLLQSPPNPTQVDFVGVFWNGMKIWERNEKVPNKQKQM
jgi:hypothetical protein